MIQGADPARCDDRYLHRIGDGTGQRQVEASARAVAVHRGQQDFPGAAFGDGPREGDRVDSGRPAPAMGENLPTAAGDGLGVDGADHALAAEPVGGPRDHVGIGDGGGVEADLVRARQQQGAHVLGCAHTAAHRQRHETLFGRARDKIEHGAAVLVSGVDVQKADLVRARRVIGARRRDRIARIDQIDEVDALDHAAIGHVEAGNDAGLQHGRSSFVAPLIGGNGGAGQRRSIAADRRRC